MNIGALIKTLLLKIAIKKSKPVINQVATDIAEDLLDGKSEKIAKQIIEDIDLELR